MMPQRETLRRIQVGLIGLGVVIALLVIGGAILSRLRSDPGKGAIALPAKPTEKLKEPLAKLGIAPADVQENISERAQQSKLP
jgi:hypothetical protein